MRAVLDGIAPEQFNDEAENDQFSNNLSVRARELAGSLLTDRGGEMDMIWVRRARGFPMDTMMRQAGAGGASQTLTFVQMLTMYGAAVPVANVITGEDLAAAASATWNARVQMADEADAVTNTVRGLPSGGTSTGFVLAVVLGSVGGVLLIVAAAWVLMHAHWRRTQFLQRRADDAVASADEADAASEPVAAPASAPTYPVVPVPPAAPEPDPKRRRMREPLSDEPLDPNAYLRDLTRDRLLRDVLHAASEDADTLVLDESARAVLMSACGAADISAAGYTAVRALDDDAGGATAMAPPPTRVYVVEPTVDRVDAIAERLSGSAGARAAAVFFTHGVAEDYEAQRARLTAANSAIPMNLMTRDVNVHFAAIEQRVFTLPGSADTSIATSLFTLCCVLGEVPKVRFLARSEAARGVAQELVGLLRAHRDLVRRAARAARLRTSSRATTTLLIVPRTVDLIAPLLHALTYRGMCDDLLSGHGDGDQGAVIDAAASPASASAPGAGAASQMMNESNDASIWPRLRHLHVTAAARRLLDIYNEEYASIDAAVFDLHSMRRAIAQVPEAERRARGLDAIDRHARVLELLVARFGERGLQKLVAVEQDVACRRDAGGKLIDEREIRNAVWRALEHNADSGTGGGGGASAAAISSRDKLRLVLLYLLSSGRSAVGDEETMLVATGEMSMTEASTLVRHVQRMRESALEEQQAARGSVRAMRRMRTAADIGTEAGELQRFVPVMRDLMEDLSLDALPTDAFPYARSSRAASKRSGAAGGSFLLGSLFRRIIPDERDEDAARDDEEGEPAAAAAARADEEAGMMRDDADNDGATPRASAESERTTTSTATTPSGASGAHASGDSESGPHVRPRTILFCVGGITAAEMRAAYDISASRERNVMIGGLEHVAPDALVSRLKSARL